MPRVPRSSGGSRCSAAERSPSSQCSSPARGRWPWRRQPARGAPACWSPRRRERYRRAVERSVPDIASAVADAVSGGHSIRGALAAARRLARRAVAPPSSRGWPPISSSAASTADALAAMRGRLRSERVDSLATALLSQQVVGRRRGGADATARGGRCGSRPGRRRGSRRHNTGALHRAAGRRPAGRSGSLRRAAATRDSSRGSSRQPASAAMLDRGWLPAARRIRPDPASRVARRNDGGVRAWRRPRSFSVCCARCAELLPRRSRSPRTLGPDGGQRRMTAWEPHRRSSTHDCGLSGRLARAGLVGPDHRAGATRDQARRSTGRDALGCDRGAGGSHPPRVDRRRRACPPRDSWDPMPGSSAAPVGASER